jgi:acetolactate synthase I/II/III large subunit
MTMADILISELQEREIPCIYSLCGNGLDPILDASARRGMRVIDTRNEQAAAYMADTAGKLSRRIGVVAVSSGAAHMNALTGVCNAWYDGSPMLLITGASDSPHRGRGNFQDMETADLARGLCKHSEYVDRPERLVPAIEEAITRAVTGRPGPVHLTVPMDVLEGEAMGKPDGPERPRSSTVSPNMRADEDSLSQAIDLIESSKKPLIIAGSGVFYANAATELAAIASAIRSPVMVPIWDRGAVDEPIPEFCGVLGAASGAPDILGEADLILLLGAEVDYRIGYLEPPAVLPSARVVRVDVDPATMCHGVNPDLALLGDPKRVMGQMLAGLNGVSSRNDSKWLEEATRRRDVFYEGFSAKGAAEGEPTGKDVVLAMGEAITDETHLLVDGGNIGQWFHMLMHDRYPARWVTCGRSGVVGWGVPSAAAVSSLNPGRRVLLLSGDGASTFTIAEIENAVRQNLPYVAVIADDCAWGIVVSGSNRRDQPAVGSKLGSIKFDEVARGFGARGVRVDDISLLPGEVEKGFDSKQVTIIHVPIQSGGPTDLEYPHAE